MSISKQVKRKWHKISKSTRVEIVSSGDTLLGIGAIEIDGVAVRSSKTEIRPDFSTPDAVHYQDFALLDIEKTDSGIVLHSEALARHELYGEMMDEYSYNLAFPRLHEIQRDRLDWIIKPVEITLDGERYVGLSIAFHFSSDRNEIHRFTTVATWEIGGR